jgi:hypothetical protein
MSWQSYADSVEAVFKVLARPFVAAGKFAAVPFLQMLKWLAALTGDDELVLNLDTLKRELLSSSEAAIAENKAKMAEASARANTALDAAHQLRLREAQALKSEAEAREAKHRADKADAEAYAIVRAADAQQVDAEVKLLLAQVQAGSSLMMANVEAFTRLVDALTKLKGDGGSLGLSKRKLDRLIAKITEQLGTPPVAPGLPKIEDLDGVAGDAANEIGTRLGAPALTQSEKLAEVVHHAAVKGGGPERS